MLAGNVGPHGVVSFPDAHSSLDAALRFRGQGVFVDCRLYSGGLAMQRAPDRPTQSCIEVPETVALRTQRLGTAVVITCCAVYWKCKAFEPVEST